MSKKHTDDEKKQVWELGRELQRQGSPPSDWDEWNRLEREHHAINAKVMKRYEPGERINDVSFVHYLVSTNEQALDADEHMNPSELNVFVYLDAFPTRRPSHRLRLRIDITKLEAGELESIPVEYLDGKPPTLEKQQ